MTFAFGLQTFKLIDFTKIFQLKGLKHKKRTIKLLSMFSFDGKVYLVHTDTLLTECARMPLPT